jgi:hypothetical protein
MLKQIDYRKFESELKSMMNSSIRDDQLECAYHYGHFGFNAYCLKYLQQAQINDDNDGVQAHWRQLEATAVVSKLVQQDYTDIPRPDFDFLNVTELEVTFPEWEGHQREIGIYIQALPYIELLKQRTRVQKIKINCTERLRELLALYFPYIEIGTHANKVNQVFLLEWVKNQGGASLVRGVIRRIAQRIRTNKNPRYLGINWFANTIFDRYRSIPIGTLINTVGNHAKPLQVKSLQYNDPQIEIDIYNRYSKNKIISTFDNDINTTAVEILDAVAECYCVVGIQSEPVMMSAWLLGIPTIVTASSPNMYWYFLNKLNPFLHIIQMRYAGDYDYITNKINRLI